MAVPFIDKTLIRKTAHHLGKLLEDNPLLNPRSGLGFSDQYWRLPDRAFWLLPQMLEAYGDFLNVAEEWLSPGHQYELARLPPIMELVDHIRDRTAKHRWADLSRVVLSFAEDVSIDNPNSPDALRKAYCRASSLYKQISV